MYLSPPTVVAFVMMLPRGLHLWRFRLGVPFGPSAAVAVFFALLAAAPARPAQGCGDLDGDGSVLARDALQVLATVVGLSDCSPCDCDVDCDREITVSDALEVLRVAVGFPAALGCCVVDGCFSDEDCQPDGYCGSDIFGCDSICIFPSTTTTSTTTTVPTAPQDPHCPDSVELTAFARTGAVCATDADCSVGVCDGTVGRCRSSSRLDYGYAGNAHRQDRNDLVKIAVKLSCSGPADPTCGECEVIGLDASAGNCRCVGDNQTICDQPLSSDHDDCGGGECRCYNGPPIPVSVGGVPLCVLERFVARPSGRINVDDGSHELSVEMNRTTYLGENNIAPCGYCDGDLVAGDGERDGTCRLGESKRLLCDVDAFHHTFPMISSRSGVSLGQSLDCFPFAGKNVSGAGVLTRYTQTTGALEPVDRNLNCDLALGPSGPLILPFECHCGLCATGACASDLSIPCEVSLDCPLGAADVCSQTVRPGAAPCHDDTDCIKPGAHKCVGAFGFTRPNNCGPPESSKCIDLGDGLGECELGPIDRFCDAVVRADGDGFIPCLHDQDCGVSTIGIAAGGCTLSRKRACFSDRVSVEGAANAHEPIAASLFCAAPIGKASLDGIIGLPGLERRLTHYRASYRCAGDPMASYEPGVGGCP